MGLEVRWWRAAFSESDWASTHLDSFEAKLILWTDSTALTPIMRLGQLIFSQVVLSKWRGVEGTQKTYKCFSCFLFACLLSSIRACLLAWLLFAIRRAALPSSDERWSIGRWCFMSEKRLQEISESDQQRKVLPDAWQKSISERIPHFRAELF